MAITPFEAPPASDSAGTEPRFYHRLCHIEYGAWGACTPSLPPFRSVNSQFGAHSLGSALPQVKTAECTPSLPFFLVSFGQRKSPGATGLRFGERDSPFSQG